MMNSKFKDHVQILLAYVVSYLVTFWVLASIIQTGCNAIFDGESGVSYMVGSAISYMVFPLIAFVIIYFRRKRVHKDRRAYLALMKEKDFDAKEDIAATLKDKNMWAEVIFVTVISFLFSIYISFVGLSAVYFIPFFLMAVPAFVGFEVLGTAVLHKTWIRENRDF
ncbi:MAG: hypothetical protein IKJ80_04075 [Clostridia bacterium]|nr:hypothetical protein [Clostridia bacterium]